MARPRNATVAPKTKIAKSYKHPESESPMRPEVGTQSEFKKRLPPKKYRYDDSLSPVLEWDGQNAARERGEARIAKAESELSEARKKLNGKPETKAAAAHVIAAQKAVSDLKAMSKPFLNWSGKAERLSFDVPTLPLFIHERLSTKAILETLKGHKRDKQTDMFDLFGDPQHSITDQVLRAYEHKDKWVNRMILGDSLVVMNSLLHYENMGGQVQMIYIDPPYGVKFGSNFQPFVRRRDVGHNDDEDMTREPEMVQAYRDTWELGLHSYLTYLRDRLLIARELLSPTGSVFVQISDQNLHHLKELLDEIFGADCYVGLITFKTGSGFVPRYIKTTSDYLLWYSRDAERTKFTRLYSPKAQGTDTYFDKVQLTDGRICDLKEFDELPKGAVLVALRPLVSSYSPNTNYTYKFEGREYYCGKNRCWKTTPDGMDRLPADHRIYASENTLKFIARFTDFPYSEITHVWDDTMELTAKAYVVQTATKVVERCLHMTTSPGDLVLDATCGSGTTAYVAEEVGRRWMTIDTD